MEFLFYSPGSDGRSVSCSSKVYLVSAHFFAINPLSTKKKDALLFAMLAREAEWRFDNFKAQELSNTAWALSRLANLTDSWGSLKHISCTGQSSSLICVQQFGALLMKYDQRGLKDYDMDFSRGLQP